MIKQAKSLAAMIKDKETAKAEESHDQAKWNLIFDLPFQDIFSNLGDSDTAQLVTSIIKLVSYFLIITQGEGVVS